MRRPAGWRHCQAARMERAVGLVSVIALHALVLWGLWQHRPIPTPTETATLFVNVVAPPTPERMEQPKRPPPKRKPIEKPRPRPDFAPLVAETPSIAPADHVAPPPPPQPAPRIEAPPTPLPPDPVALGTELAVACPERTAPAYPAVSRRSGEEGTVVLRVELDETGRVAAAHVQSSSGHARLDEAALKAVKTWRCSPAQRNGQPVSATALQPFKFVLRGS